MTTIRVRRLVLPAIIGVYPHERLAPQQLFLDVEMIVGDSACVSDDLKDAVDYDRLTQELRSMAAETSFFLIERLAAHLMDHIIAQQSVQEATITLSKPDALAHAQTVEVILTRQA